MENHFRSRGRWGLFLGLALAWSAGWSGLAHAEEKTAPATASEDAAAPAAAKASDPTPPPTAEAALKRAGEQKKHLFLLVFRQGVPDMEKIEALFAKLEKAEVWQKKALFYQLDLAQTKERAFAEKYHLYYAPLPLILVFAPNGALVKPFVRQVVEEKQLAAALASPSLAEALKALQDGQAVLLCVQGKKTKHNAESLKAAQELLEDERAKDAVALVQVAPEDPACQDVFKRFRVATDLEEATIFFLFPPEVRGGQLAGPADKERLWNALLAAFQSGGPG